ncbi:hypothetical protein ACIFOE_21110 [Paenibacillus sp. NRS-1783]|uniref:hypothetical protein n=1 Tax=Paenibacillus sp. NRS-1783 TaxID=3233907 RepID=UPI003D2A9386
MSDSSRITEFLYAYENIELNKEEKFALMIIIISSFNDAIVEGKAEDRTKQLDNTLDKILELIPT